MSKRRNPKKEKAERNKAYARQFRKKVPRYNTRGKGFNRDNKPEDKDSSENDSE